MNLGPFYVKKNVASQIDKNADGKTVKKEYRRLSRLHHPDRGGDASKAQEINAAYEILADPEKRKKYDKYGLEGLSEEGGGGRGPEDLFSSFFSNSRSRGPQRSPDVNHPVSIPTNLKKTPLYEYYEFWQHTVSNKDFFRTDVDSMYNTILFKKDF